MDYPTKSLECLCFNKLVEILGCCRIYLFVLENATESDRQDLMSELSIMKKLPPHRHVVKLLGCITTSGILSSDKKNDKIKITRWAPREKWCFWPHLFGQNGWILSARSVSLCVFMDRSQKEISNWSSNISPRTWSITQGYCTVQSFVEIKISKPLEWS